MGMLLWAVPLAAIALIALLRGKALHAISVSASAVLLVAASFVTAKVMSSGTYCFAFWNGLFFVDSVSIIVLDIVLLIGLMAAVYSIGYLEQERTHGKIDDKRMKLYYILMYCFIFTMIFALTVRNMGVMWIAIEATTLASAFLVGFNNDKSALEGAWKYVIICSVGISVALLGIIFLHVSASGTLGEAKGLDWTALFDNAKALKSQVLRFAFLFILVGFGTKAGLAPMHTWLPDAHSQAPSPISALLSGVLLNSAMYGIIRTVAIVNKNLGNSTFTGGLMITAGLLSILTAALFILTQKDYKRLLAYSSIEHMGIISLSVGLFTPASLFAAFFHMINHSLTKSMLFLSSGSVLQKYGTRDISKVKGLLKALPVTGTVFLLGLFAIGGMPPFSVFASEFNVLASLFQAGKPDGVRANVLLLVIGGITVLLLALVFAGIVYALFRMFHDRSAPDAAAVQPGETNIAGAAVLVLLLITVAAMGITMPEGLKNLIASAAEIIKGGHA
jgi:hydrogenase-4 component F